MNYRHSHWDKKFLGQGTFGLVHLFYSVNTGDKIVLKEMKVDIVQDMQPAERDKMMIRLKNEIKIMWEHDCPNLVRAIGPPQDIPYYPAEDIMHVWMEYCDGGDLRTVLRAFSNCCGVEEETFRHICGDINSGIRYLHRISIIHRDLKPENILMKRIDANTVVYKLTDFGYAKAYNGFSSKAESLVGTPQYVAPEVIDQDSHGRAVDFWSFGVVAFELVTGIRPFLHNKCRGPLDWIGPTVNKPDNCIYITFGTRNTVIESERLPSPHQLSSVFAEELTKWLQIALHQKPENRGIADHTSNQEAPCLLQMEQLLQTKVLNIICMSKGHIFSYRVKDDSSLESLCVWLERKGYQKSKQYLITERGQLLNHQGREDVRLHSFLEWVSNISTLYLFCKDLVPSFKLVEHVTPSVQTLITSGDSVIHKDDLRQHYAHAYSHIKEQEKLFWRLHSGHEAILGLIESLCKDLQDIKLNTSGILKCLGAAEFMRNIHLSDIEELKNCRGMNSFMERQWTDRLNELDGAIKGLDSLVPNVYSLEQRIHQAVTTTEVLKQSVLSSHQYFKDFNSECVTAALDIIKEERDTRQHQCMSDLLTKASQMAINIIQDHLNRVDFLEIYLNLKNIFESIQISMRDVDSFKKQCTEISEAIHKDMWSLINSSPSRSSSIGGIDVTQSLNNSIFNGYPPPPSLSERSNSAASCTSILLRMKSQSSMSDDQVDTNEELQVLVGSLKQEILSMADSSAKEIKRNETLRSDHRINKPGEEHQSSSSQ